MLVAECLIDVDCLAGNSIKSNDLFIIDFRLSHSSFVC